MENCCVSLHLMCSVMWPLLTFTSPTILLNTAELLIDCMNCTITCHAWRLPVWIKLTNPRQLAANFTHEAPLVNVMLVNVIRPVAVPTGSQVWPRTSTVRCDRSDQWHSGREETACLQGRDHRRRGGAHSHPGNEEEGGTRARGQSFVLIVFISVTLISSKSKQEYSLPSASKTTLCVIWYILKMVVTWLL